MKKSRDEIADSIGKRKLIFFETTPMNFDDEIEDHMKNCGCTEGAPKGPSKWKIISD